MEYGETCIPGRMAGLCKLLTVIDVKLFMVHSVATRIKSINKEISKHCRNSVEDKTVFHNIQNIILCCINQNLHQ
jgi:hypothetical protein